MPIFKEVDDSYGVILEYGGSGEYLYFERHEIKKMAEELKEIMSRWEKPKLTPEEANQIEHMRSADECSKRGNFVLGGPVIQKKEKS